MPKRILTGKVLSNKADKTVTVLVERRIMHPIYKKFVTKSKKVHAHDKDNKFQPGDTVEIVETKPFSKTKKFLFVEDGLYIWDMRLQMKLRRNLEYHFHLLH